ncbi:hypothetical protein [Paenibacillus daejeonensis]|uniref:hypothetical protein n=1 Tax=Paenibacillus daejeonensis TaxID=135193 RepID=UPI00035DE893|nr:hypothetical protein [Paenibacillus daejeonensis]
MADNQGSPKVNSNKGCLFFILFFALVALFVATNLKEESPDAAPKKSTKSEPSSTLVMSGQNGKLKTTTYIGLGESKDNYNEMMKYIVADNLDAVGRMLLDGRITMGKAGDAVTVIDRGIMNTKIELLSTGQRGWVPSEFVIK